MWNSIPKSIRMRLTSRVAFFMQGGLVFSILFTVTHCDTTYNETFEEYYAKQDRLITHVFSGYRKDVPPVNVRGRYAPVLTDPMIVNVTLMYAKLISVEEPRETVRMIVEYNLCWKDPRLKWDPSEFDDIEEFVVNRELVWRANLMPHDSESVSETRNENMQHVHISSTGLVEFYVSSVVSSACPIDVKTFPFDRQKCEIDIASYNFPSTELRVVAGIFNNYNRSDAGNGEWSVDGLTAKVSSLMPTVAGYNFDVATFTFHLRRSSIFYVIMIIIPSFVLTFLCVLGLFWSEFDHRDYLEKLGLGFAAILAMCMVLEIAEGSVPKTRQLPSLSVYILVNLLLITLAILIVTMASKPCSLEALESLNTNKRLQHFRMKLCAKFRFACLILFPLGSIVNLLVLLSNV